MDIIGPFLRRETGQRDKIRQDKGGQIHPWRYAQGRYWLEVVIFTAVKSNAPFSPLM
nr:hypothetical protein [uncultured Desulfobulbus sp.]